MSEVVLCERHVGEAFPPRCADCDAEQVKAAAEIVHRRLEIRYPVYAKRPPLEQR